MRSARTSLLALGVTVVGVVSGTGTAFAASPTDGLVSSVQQTVGTVTSTVTQATGPVSNVAKPVTDAVQPVAPVQAPAAQAPAVEAPKPVADAAAPVTNLVKPVTDVAKPVTDAAKPVTDAVKLPMGAPAPATDAAKSVTDKAKPATDAAKPATDVLKPVTAVVNQVAGKAGAPALPGQAAAQRTDALATRNNESDGGGDILSDNDIDVEVGDVLSDLVDVVVSCNSVAAVLAKADNDANCGQGGRKGGKDDDHGKPAAYSSSSLGGGGDIGSDNDVDVEVGDVASDLVDIVVSCNSVAAILAIAHNDANCGQGGRKGHDGGKDDDGKASAYSASSVLDGGGDIASDNDIDVTVGDVLSDLVDVAVTCNSVAAILAKADNDANCGGGKGHDKGRLS